MRKLLKWNGFRNVIDIMCLSLKTVILKELSLVIFKILLQPLNKNR